jgi:DNA replication protein DnaC
MTDDQLIARAQANFQRQQATLALQKQQEAEKQRLSDAVAQDAAERVLAMFAAKSQAFLADLAKLPTHQDCERHPGTTAVLNEEASLKAARAVYRCPLCVDAKAKQRWERLVIEAGIPADVRHATLANFDTARPNVTPSKDAQGNPTGCVSPAKFVESCQAFLAREARNLFLCGGVGIGKGHLAAAVALQRLRDGWKVIWTDCAALFRACHAAYAAEGWQVIADRHAGADLLILDEICLKALPTDGEEILFSILDQRHKAGLQTVLLGNAPAQQVREWLGSRILDRLRSGGCKFCFGAWDSMRGHERDGTATDEF